MKRSTIAPLLLAPAALLAGPAETAAGQQHLFQLTASDAAPFDAFGVRVSLSGGRALVGARYGDGLVPNSGSAYVYDVATGHQLFELAASDGSADDQFGYAVALSGDRALVGASQDDDLGPGSGSAYVFDATNGQELFKLTASDAAAGGGFGLSVAISGDRAVVGGAVIGGGGAVVEGAAYVFDVTTGQELFQLTASDGTSADKFGASVAIDGDRILVGAWGDGDNGPWSGSAYVFDATTGQELFKLRASDGAAGDLFGLSVAIRNGLALVGATDDDDQGSGSGAAYVFDTTTGQQLFKLVAPDGSSYDGFGRSVALDDGRALVGALGDDDQGSDSGSAYLFDATTGQNLFKLLDPGGSAGDLFGLGVALEDGRALVGSPCDDDQGADAGSAHLFSVPEAAGVPYCFGDGSGAACPCGNMGATGAGCANSSGAGATLAAGGSTSVSADELTFGGSHLLPTQPALLFAGESAVAGGDGVPFGDGLRCAGTEVVRLGVEVPDATGGASWGPGLAALAGWSAGDLRYFQAWYRDPSGPCGSGFNLTNGLEVVFVP